MLGAGCCIRLARDVIVRFLVFLALVFPVVPAEAREVPRLNSERIEAKYGSYGLQVLERDPVRVSMLYSTHGQRKVCRTLALVQFADPGPASLANELVRIRAGLSLGATLKKAGWTISKKHFHLGSVPAGPRFQELAGIEGSPELAVAIYDLFVRKGEETHRVATIIEIHHPDYLGLADLQRLVPELQPGTDPRVEALRALARQKMEGDDRLIPRR